MNGSAIRAVTALKRMDPVEPDAFGIFTKRVGIGQRGRMSAGIPFLAVYRTCMTTDANIKVDDQPEFFTGGVYGDLSHLVSPRLKAREYILP